MATPEPGAIDSALVESGHLVVPTSQPKLLIAVRTAQAAAAQSRRVAARAVRARLKLRAVHAAEVARLAAQAVAADAEAAARLRQADARLLQTEARLVQQTAAAEDLARELRLVLTSRFWALTAPLRWLMRLLRPPVDRVRLVAQAARPGNAAARQVLQRAVQRRLRGAARTTAWAEEGLDTATSCGERRSGIDVETPPESMEASYPAWLARFDSPDVQTLERLAATAANVPEVLIVARFDANSAHLAGDTAAALRRCIGLRWTALFAFDPGCHADHAARFSAMIRDDARFGRTAADGCPEGGLILSLAGGAMPRPHGPRLLIDALVREPGASVAYSDEDMLSAEGDPGQPWFKPAFSRLLNERGVLLGGMVALRPSANDPELVRRLAVGSDGQAAVVRVLARVAGESGVLHVPHVLFHSCLPPAEPLPLVLPELPDPLPMASILIATRNRWNLLGTCLQSLELTDWPRHRLEIIVIDNGSTDAETLRELAAAERAGRIRLLRDPRPFNFARLNNTAARIAKGELLVLLNNDTEVLDPAWLQKLAAYAMQPNAGAIGCKLLYGDGTVQHGGVVLGIQGVAAHAHVGIAAADGGYRGLANLTHEVAAITGACLAITRRAFDEVGGLNEAFQTAFNDVCLCLDLHARGLRNVYVADPLLTHHESRTRGLDDTPTKQARWRQEASEIWRLHAPLLRADPFYSPNLSLLLPYLEAVAPRQRPAWRPAPRQPLRIMMLSCTHARGHGVAVVLDLQLRALLARGHEVFPAGSRSARDLDYGGREVIALDDPLSVGAAAADLEIDLIVAHTPPYFDVARWMGSHPPVLAYDYGEPPPELFPDAVPRRAVLEAKRMALGMATKVLAISEAVAAEAAERPEVVPLGNSHLGRWDAAMMDRRRRVRRERGWVDLKVVLNVCRFEVGERAYKGVDFYADVQEALELLDPIQAAGTVFVLCGKGSPDDVDAMESRGLIVIANVSDADMAGLYAAADVYANFSQWEGYNLGIGQALAMGLPVVASDIPAHRSFGVGVAGDSVEAGRLILGELERDAPRVPRVTEWEPSLASFIGHIEAMCGLDAV